MEAEAKCLCALRFICALAPLSTGGFPSRCAERVVISSVIFDRTCLLTAQQAERFHSIFRKVCQCDRWEMFSLCVLNLHFSKNEWLEHWSHSHLWVCEFSLAVFYFSSGFSLLVFHQLTDIRSHLSFLHVDTCLSCPHKVTDAFHFSYTFCLFYFTLLYCDNSS